MRETPSLTSRLLRPVSGSLRGVWQPGLTGDGSGGLHDATVWAGGNFALICTVCATNGADPVYRHQP